MTTNYRYFKLVVFAMNMQMVLKNDLKRLLLLDRKWRTFQWNGEKMLGKFDWNTYLMKINYKKKMFLLFHLEFNW